MAAQEGQKERTRKEEVEEEEEEDSVWKRNKSAIDQFRSIHVIVYTQLQEHTDLLFSFFF